jgi:hypothetical protein
LPLNPRKSARIQFLIPLLQLINPGIHYPEAIPGNVPCGR